MTTKKNHIQYCDNNHYIIFAGIHIRNDREPIKNPASCLTGLIMISNILTQTHGVGAAGGTTLI